MTLAILTITHQAAAFPSIYPPGGTGIDVSWPPSNCNTTPPPQADFGIVGVTGGLNFTQNPCLFSEAHWFDHLSLYMNTGYPELRVAQKFAQTPKPCSSGDNQCVAYDYGFNAAEYAILYAASQGVHATVWWLDVETENSWSPNHTYNRESIQGAIDAIKQETILPTIGIYSTPMQWRIITGDWRNYLPNWVGTGSSKRNIALAACKTSDFTLGGTWLAQYVLELDHDVVCQN